MKEKQDNYIVVLVTAKDFDEANKIAAILVSEKLIACANIIKDVKSIFWWEGKVDTSNEVLLILKSQEKLFEKIINTVKSIHSYQVPEIIALPIIKGSKDYLKWIDEAVTK